MATFNKPIIVSKHAMIRLKQRFGLLFSSDNFKHPSLTESLMLGQLRGANICVKWKMVPFYTNMYNWKYNYPFNVYRNGSIFYIVAEGSNNYMITTVVKSWHCE